MTFNSLCGRIYVQQPTIHCLMLKYIAHQLKVRHFVAVILDFWHNELNFVQISSAMSVCLFFFFFFHLSHLFQPLRFFPKISCWLSFCFPNYPSASSTLLWTNYSKTTNESHYIFNVKLLLKINKYFTGNLLQAKCWHFCWGYSNHKQDHKTRWLMRKLCKSVDKLEVRLNLGHSVQDTGITITETHTGHFFSPIFIREG